MSENLRIDHLVIITGPTSSGKSTLLSAIEGEKLDDDTAKLFPDEIHTWPFVSAMGQLNDTLADGHTGGNGEALKGMVLHYDLLCPYKKFMKEFEEDAISGLLDQCKKVSAYILKPDKPELLAQLKKGELEGKNLDDQSSGIKARRILSSMIALIPSGTRKTIKKKLFPNKKTTITDFNEVLFFKYQEDGWLEEWYKKFDAFLERKNKSGPDIKQYYLKPVINDKHNWTMLRQIH